LDRPSFKKPTFGNTNHSSLQTLSLSLSLSLSLVGISDSGIWVLLFAPDREMGSLGAMLKHPDDIYPLLKLKMAARHIEKQIPPQPHWAFCYTMLHKVSRSFALVIQQLNTDLRNAVSFFSSCVF
jgi:hypothetical protein